MIKSLRKDGIEETLYITITKAVYDKPTANIKLWKAESFFYNTRNKTKMPTLTASI